MIDRTPPAVHLRIGAERRASGSGGVYQHVNPATGQPDAEIPLAGPAEVDEAARTAHAAFAGWRATRPAERRRLNWKSVAFSNSADVAVIATALLERRVRAVR